MILGWLLGASIAYGVLKGGSEAMGEYGKAAYPTLNEDEFDKHNMAYGINPKEVMKIAARNGVRPNKHGILPYFGYRHCLDYVAKYKNKPEDSQIFIQEWIKTVKAQEAKRAEQLIKESKESYKKWVQMFKEKKETGRRIILTYSHWWFLTEEEHQERVDNIYNNTYMGECSVQPPRVRFDPEIFGKRTEVWVVRGKEGDKQDERQTMARWNALYSLSCEQCGYDKNEKK